MWEITILLFKSDMLKGGNIGYNIDLSRWISNYLSNVFWSRIEVREPPDYCEDEERSRQPNSYQAYHQCQVDAMEKMNLRSKG